MTTAETMIKATLIRKEEIPDLKFLPQDVLSDIPSRIARREDLEKAMRLGNNDHFKIKIFFESEAGTMMTETTIWNLTQNYVILKANIDIPIRSIYHIEF